jgi:hypothetical protein
MKLCLMCDKSYPDTEEFCEMDGELLIEVSERPPDLCPACDGLSPGISMDGETIMHCSTCHDKHAVTVEDADRWREEMRA